MYYDLDCDEASMSAYITPEEESGEPLILGRIIDPNAESAPLRFRYRDPTGAPLYDYYSGKSLMSRRLVDALEEAGVDNLQRFEVDLVEEGTGNVNRDFWNVNIVGMVACADMGRSRTSELGSSCYFHKLVVDARKTHGLLMFRVAESMINVLLHESIARAIQAGGFRGIVLTPLEGVPG